MVEGGSEREGERAREREKARERESERGRAREIMCVRALSLSFSLENVRDKLSSV